MNLFGYFSIGLQSMNAAQLGLRVAGDNIANAFTPGYARRRVDLTSGYQVNVPGGLLGQGVQVEGLRRMEDRFLQASLQREQGRQAGGEERLRGLRQVESFFGNLEQGGSIASTLAGFSASFDELAGQADNLALRRGAISSAESAARAIRDTYGRLETQRGLENQAAESVVARVNSLAGELAGLNRQIAIEESAGGVAAPLRDQRIVVIDELVQLTGGSAVTDDNGRVQFSFRGGPTLVTGDDALPLKTRRAADGTLRILSGADGRDITDRLREGRLGGVLYLRDETIAGRLADLDLLATDLIGRANALTTGAFDLQGNAGGALFQPDPPAGPGVARNIAVDTALQQDPTLLAVSTSGAPGDGDVALQLAGLSDAPAAGLGGRSAAGFVGDLLSGLGDEIARTDVGEGVARSLVDNLSAQIDSVSGVSLDEEAVSLIEYQRSYEAAARFIQVLNSFTEIAVNLVGR